VSFGRVFREMVSSGSLRGTAWMASGSVSLSYRGRLTCVFIHNRGEEACARSKRQR